LIPQWKLLKIENEEEISAWASPDSIGMSVLGKRKVAKALTDN
jgi:hypothetical protein